MFGADGSSRRRHGLRVLTSQELLTKLRALRDDGRTTNADLSRLLNLPSPRIVEIFDGNRRITIDEMKTLVEHFDLQATGARPRENANDDVVEIPALDLSLSMGPGTLIEDFVESEPVKMSLWLIQSITRTPSDRLRLVRGHGESMEPTLRSSDRVLVDINDRHLTRIDGIYWINQDGVHGIKRLRPAGKGRTLVKSDNPAVGDYEVDARELRIEGRVIWFAREL